MRAGCVFSDNTLSVYKQSAGCNFVSCEEWRGVCKTPRHSLRRLSRWAEKTALANPLCQQGGSKLEEAIRERAQDCVRQSRQAIAAPEAH
jgi:hypothetical protein